MEHMKTIDNKNGKQFSLKSNKKMLLVDWFLKAMLVHQFPVHFRS